MPKTRQILKSIKRNFYKGVKQTTAFIVILSAVLSLTGVPYLMPVKQAQATSATVTWYGCGNNPCYWIPAQGQVVPASSSPLSLFSFNLANSGAATFTSIAFNLYDSGTPTTTASEIARLSVYKRTSWDMGGMMYAFPIGDRIGTTTSIGAFSAGVSANTITIGADAVVGSEQVSGDESIPSDQWSAEYYVTMETSATWADTDQIRYTMAADWVTVSNGTVGSAFTGQSSTDNYYATAPTGWSGTTFAVNMVEYMGTVPGGTNHEVEVRFSNDVTESLAETVTNYTIGVTNPDSATLMSPMAVRLVFPAATTITANETSLVIDKDITDMMGSVLHATTDITMVITGGSGGGGSAVMISEVMIGNSSANGGLNEFIELYSTAGVNFANMPVYIWINDASGHTKIADIASGAIAANGYYLIASSQYTGISTVPDTTYDATLTGCDAAQGCLQPNSGVYVSTNSASQNIGVMNRLGWGTATGAMSDGPAKCSSSDPEACTVTNDAKSLERKANHSSTAASMSSGADITNGNSYTSFSNQFDFIQRTTSDPQKTGTTESPGGAGYGATNNPPYINHQPLSIALDTNDLIAIAEFMDDSGQVSASNTEFCYDINRTSGWTWTCVSGTQTTSGSSFYRFTIPNSALNATNDLDYFLRVNDGTNYTCLPGGACAVGAPAVGSTPFYINITDTAGTGVISGTVQDSSSVAIPNVMVYAEGMPYTTTTNASGGYSLTGLPDGVYDITASGGSYTVGAATHNYLDGMVYGIYLNSNSRTSTGNNITLIQGVVESVSGNATDQENPWVMWSAPNDMMQGFFESQDLIVVFDRAMQSSTITGGSATTNNVYLIDNAGTIVAGTVIYYPDTTGRPASLPSDSYMMTYNPTADLSPGASYTLVLKDTIIGQNGQRLMGNRPSGGHSIGFTVAMDFGSGGTGGGDAATYNFGSGASFPPYVTGSTPGEGAFSASLNTKINITFNEAMSSSSISSTNIRMYTVSNPYTANESETTFTGYAVTQNTAGNMVILTPSSNLTASTQYRVKVLSNCASADGTPMSNSDNAEQFRLDFETGTSADTTAPTVAGTYPSNNETGVPNNLSVISVGFSEAMDASTINARTVQLKRGTTAVAATINYDIADKSAYIMPTNALRPGASYTITIVSGSSGVKALAGTAPNNELGSNYEASFTTDSTADATAPTIEYARCDDYSCSITYSEPMKSARSDDTANYAASVLKPANYAITGAVFTNARAEYDQMNNTARLEGITGLTAGQSYTITVSNVQDKAGNGLSGGAASFTGTVENSMATGGMMGPGGPGPMMGPATMMDAGGNQYGAAGFTDSTYAMGGGGGAAGGSDMTAGMGGSMGFDFGGMWMEPINVMPMNMMAGATTSYMVQFKADSAIASGGTIKITFPTGTDVASAAAVATTKSMPNKDINGPMDATTVTIASVAKNAASRTVTVTTSGNIATNDFLMFDIGGIKNPTVPKGFDTNGYTADIKTFNVAGALLQSKSSMPFFINASGAYTLTGTITATDATAGTANVYLDSWITGPMEDEVTFASGSGTYSFTGLSEGDYHLRTEPSISLTGGDYIGYNKPDPIWVSSSNTAICSSTTCTKNISFTKESASTAFALTVYIVGDFSGMSATDSEIDIWAGGPNGHTMKTVDLSQANCTGTTCSSTLYLPSTGEWYIGMGPAMPHGAMMMGPMPMPSWMPPQDVRVNIAGTYGSPTYVEQSGTANDGKITFTISAASNQIIGYVVNSSGTAIANVDVDAHRTQGGFGMPAHAQTATNGMFVLKVGTGIYEINAWMPGLPWSPGRVVDVKTDTGNVLIDGNATANVYKDNGTTLVLDVTTGYNSAIPETELLIKINKSSTTISGQLLDDAGSPVGYAPVWAYNQLTGMHMPSGTDSSGNYTIYADVGDWYVEAFIPGLGDVSYANNPVSVTAGSSASNINIRPASGIGFATITGAITGVTNANVWAEGVNPAGGYYHNGTNTDSSGGYRLRVPTASSGSTTYTLHAWTPSYGDLAPISIAVSGTTTYTGGADYTDFSVASMKTLTLNFTGYATVKSGTEAFVDVFKPGAGMGMRTGNHIRIDDLSTTASTTLLLPADTGYEISVHIPGLGNVSSTCADDGANVLCTAGSPNTWQVVNSGAVTFNLSALGDIYTFTVTVNDGTNPLADSFVWLGGSSFHSGEPTNSSGIATLTVPDGTYELGADKPGYTSPAPTTIITSTDAVNCNSIAKTCTKTISLGTNPYTLSGTITNPSAAAVSNAWVWADQVTSATDFSFIGGWTGTQTNPDGTYELSISNGFWLVRAVSDAYQETGYTVSGAATAIQINSASLSNKNIQLAARSGYTAVAPKSAPVTPASGGTVDDLANTGVKLTIPPAALGTGTSAGTVNITETYTVPSTQEFVPVAGTGTIITATNNSGQAVTSLSGSVTMEMGYSEANLPTGVAEADLILAYYDDSSNQWVAVSSSQDTTNNSFSGATTHFSDFALVYARGNAPSTPSNLAATAASSSQIDLSWIETSGTTGYYIYRDTSSGGTYPLLTTITSSSTVAYSDTGLNSSATYYYKISAYLYSDTNESAASSVVSATTTGAATASQLF